MSEKQQALLEQLEVISDHWIDAFASALQSGESPIWTRRPEIFGHLRNKLSTDEISSLIYLNSEMVNGVIHSILVMLDGGSALSDRAKVDLIDIDTQESLIGKDALHEMFSASLAQGKTAMTLVGNYLLGAGRLPQEEIRCV